MPNWVYNGLTVAGSKEALDRFAAEVGRAYERDFTDHTGLRRTERVEEPVLSFWNIHRPADEILDTYHAVAGSEMMSNPDNWYNWNVREWGVKWDASEPEVERYADDHLFYRFSTPWSPPYPVLVKASEKFPEVQLFLEWEEEQGFGGEVKFEAGVVEELRSWDIPSTHAEHAERDRECVCSYDEEEMWFDDCPRETDPAVAAAVMEDLVEAIG